MPAETVDIVSNKEVTINFHHWCLTPQNFSAFHMENFWKMLATGKDINQLGKYSVDHQWCQRGSPKGATFKGASRWLSNIAIGNGGGFLLLFFLYRVSPLTMISSKGQLISKANCQAVDSTKKMNKRICSFWLEEFLRSKVKSCSFIFLENLRSAILLTILDYLKYNPQYNFKSY